MMVEYRKLRAVGILNLTDGEVSRIRWLEREMLGDARAALQPQDKTPDNTMGGGTGR